MTPSDPKNTNNHSENPGAKLRSILAAPKDDAAAPPPPLPHKALPKKLGTSTGSPQKQQAKARRDRKFRIPFRRDKVAPAFWTVASIVSLSVNLVMLIALFFLSRELVMIKGLVTDLLGGLHSSFVLMDKASIETSVEVETEIPINFSLPVNAVTQVQLTEDVTITGAHVVIDTLLLDINAPARVTLPAGTYLPISLNISVPVETSVPVKLNVPVDIALVDTDLHTPFVGLKDVIQPYHCLLEPDAKLLLIDGTVFELCKDQPAP